MASTYLGHQTMIPLNVVNQESVQGVLTNSSVALLTAPTAGKYVITSIQLLNRHSGTNATTIRKVESGGTDDATADIFTPTLPANDAVLVEYENGFVIKNGASIKGLAATTATVNYVINYLTEI